MQAHTAVSVLPILNSRRRKAHLSFDDIEELADPVQTPPNLSTESLLWQAYAALEKTKVKGAGGRRILTDRVSLVRFAIHQDNELIPFPKRVQANFNAWLTEQRCQAQLRHSRSSEPAPAEAGGGNPEPFTPEQMHWQEMIRDHIAANLGIETDDFEYAPFSQEGGLGKVYQLFGDDLSTLIEQLNETLAE